MDYESWMRGYLTGVALHFHVRIPQLSPGVIASMSATGIAADLDWFADLSGVAAITRLSAAYAGNVTASYSFDGRNYSNPVPMAQLLAMNPGALSAGLDPDAPRLYFRFHLAHDADDLTSFTLWGFSGRADNGV